MLTCNFLIIKNKSIKEKENLQKMEHFLINISLLHQFNAIYNN